MVASREVYVFRTFRDEGVIHVQVCLRSCSAASQLSSCVWVQKGSGLVGFRVKDASTACQEQWGVILYFFVMILWVAASGACN